MNKKVNKFSLAGDKSMPEMHLRQREFTYNACAQFKKKQRKNPKILRNRTFTLYLLKRTR